MTKSPFIPLYERGTKDLKKNMISSLFCKEPALSEAEGESERDFTNYYLPLPTVNC
jgi:hypothetical protein